MRSTRYLFARRCPVSTARALTIIPVFAKEALSGIRGTVHVRSLPSVGNAFQFIGPNGAVEYNMYGMYVPWAVVSTFSGGDGADMEVDDLPHPPATTGEWDAMFRRLLLEFGTDGNEYYGANPDGTSTTYDTVKNVWVRRRGDSDNAPSEGMDTAATTDEPMTYGPSGIQRIFSRETILTSDSVSTIQKNVSGLAAIFSSAPAVNDLVYADHFEVSEPAFINGPGYLIIGVVRFAVDETEGHAASYVGVADDASKKARNRALNALIGGDHDRVQWLIKNGTSAEADYARSVLFGGDNFLEDAGAYTPVDFFSDGSWFRPNELVVTGKFFAGHNTPYELRPAV